MKSSKVVTAFVLLSSLFFALSRMDSLAVSKKEAANRYLVSGTATETHEVLSGIRPTEAMEKEWKVASPLVNKTFYVRLGSANKYTRKVYRKFTTDSLGHFKISLPPGTYCIVEQVKRDPLKIPDYSVQNKSLQNFNQYQVGDKKCFEDWYKTCDATLEVKNKDILDFTFNIHHGWNSPCVTGGPMPE